MAFYAIYASEADAGEYCRTLFTVVAASLLISWLLAMTITPLQCIDMLPDPKPEKDGGESMGPYRRLLSAGLRFRWPFLGVMAALLAVAMFNFGQVKQMFFPDSARAQLMVDFWYANGTRVQDVARDIEPAEAYLMKDERVAGVSSFIGQGPPRFYLPVDLELLHPNYAEIVVNTHSYEEVDPLIADIEPWMRENVPGAVTRVRKYGVGPSDTWKFEHHISGPG